MDKPSGTGTSGIDVAALTALVKEVAALEAVLKAVVREALKEQRTPDKPFTRPELIAHLRLSKTTFDRLEAKGLGPRKTKLSARRICYLFDDVRAWQEKRKV